MEFLVGSSLNTRQKFDYMIVEAGSAGCVRDSVELTG
jgi:hypothetical protein